MTLQASEIITNARRLLRQTDPANSNWTDNELLVIANMAKELLPIEIGGVRKLGEIEGDGSYKYSLPFDLVSLEQVQKNKQEIPVIPSKQFNFVDVTTGEATSGIQGMACCIIGDSIYFAPGLNGTAILQYRARPLDVDNSEGSYDMPRSLLLPMAYRIAADCAAEIESTQGAFFEQRYRDSIEQAEAAEKSKQLAYSAIPQIPAPR